MLLIRLPAPIPPPYVMLASPARFAHLALVLLLATLLLAGFAGVAVARALSPGGTSSETPADPFLAAQAAAMLPAYAGDLGRAAEWDRYTLNVVLSPTDRRVRGTLRLQLTNRSQEPYTRLYFQLYPNHPDFGGRLDVIGATLDGQPVNSGTEQGDRLLWLALPRPLPPGASTSAELSFVARTPRNASGSSFGAFNQEAGLWSLAGFYPVLARNIAGIGWDRRPISSRGDFAVTATALYDVTVEAPVAWDLVSTGVRIASEPLSDGLRRERFVSGPQREFYLGATSTLDQVSTTVDGVRVVSHYQQGMASAGREALRVAAEALTSFNQRYGPYPLSEFEVVQGAMTTFLGMEYPGVVLIEQTLYRDAGRDLETTIAHEVSHQWWYSLVGNDAQGEAWLDEGLASYAQVIYYEQQGELEFARAELDAYRDSYRRLQAQGRDAPLATPPSALKGNYVSVVYDKGALFFHALRRQIGEAAFGRFLNGYFTASRYREIAGPDLLRAAETACSCELDQLYTAWVTTLTPVPLP